MKVALLLLLIGAVAAPSFCWVMPSIPDVWSGPVQKGIQDAKALVEKAKTDLDKLLSQGNKEKAAQLINDAILKIKKSLDSLQNVTKLIPGVSEKVKDVVAKATAVLDDLKAKAKEATKQENVQKVKAALREAMSKAVTQIKNILSQFRAPRDN